MKRQYKLSARRHRSFSLSRRPSALGETKLCLLFLGPGQVTLLLSCSHPATIDTCLLTHTSISRRSLPFRVLRALFRRVCSIESASWLSDDAAFPSFRDLHLIRASNTKRRLSHQFSSAARRSSWQAVQLCVSSKHIQQLWSRCGFSNNRPAGMAQYQHANANIVRYAGGG